MTATSLQFVRAERTPDTAHFKGHFCFDVVRDGVKIAQWKPMGGFRVYMLFDLSGRQVRAPYLRTSGERGDLDSPWRWRDVECKSQAEFAAQITQEFAYIPTATQIAERQEQEAAEAAREAGEVRERARVRRIQEAGEDLASALKNVMARCAGLDPSIERQAHEALAKAGCL